MDANPVDVLTLLKDMPPLMQVVVVLAAAIVLAFIYGRKFLRHLVAGADQPRDFAIGEPTTFADMQPVRDLVVATKDNTLVTGNLMQSIGRLTDLVGQLVVDLREEREHQQDKEREAAIRREAELLGYQRAMEEAAKAAAKAPARRRRRTTTQKA